jgi:hypothetical protein
MHYAFIDKHVLHHVQVSNAERKDHYWKSWWVRVIA